MKLNLTHSLFLHINTQQSSVKSNINFELQLELKILDKECKYLYEH